MANEYDTRDAILASGKQEFLEHGFEKASLRTICNNAHVTTGAFYTYFRKKEELFDAIVEEDLAEYAGRFDGMMRRLTASLQAPMDNEVDMMDYLMERRDLFRLLFECSDGTRYAGFKESLIGKFESSYQVFFDAHSAEPIDREVTRVIVEMKFAQYCRMLFGGCSAEEARKITEQLARATRAGFEALLQKRF